MTETIQVGYKSVVEHGSVVYHKYILYTNGQGERFYARGGPGYFGPGAENGGAEEASFNPIEGNIKTETGKYEPGTPDWDWALDPVNPDLADTPDFYEPIKTGDDLSSDWQKIKDAMRDIDLEDHPYYAERDNSNTAADEALKRSGLPQPVHGNLPGDYLAPGSGIKFLDTSHLPEWLKRHPDPNKPIPGDANRNGIPDIHESIDPAVRDNMNSGSAAQRRRDPLVFDLDNDGIETTGVSSTTPVLFDHDADGVKTSSGWVKSDDAFLVRDVDGNGMIDSGRELFGDATLKSNGQLAFDGFDALADLDSNADGNVSSADTQFSNLRLWRDFNQDGVSQVGELFTLTSQNIASINVAIGGDIAYLYGNNIDPTGAGLINTQSVISTASFGQTPQTLNTTNLIGGGGEGGW